MIDLNFHKYQFNATRKFIIIIFFFIKKKIMRLSFSSHELIFGRQMPERSLGGEKEKRG